MRASGPITSLIVLLACSSLACSDDTTEINPCAVVRTTLIEPRVVCGVTPTGLVLHGDQELVLERLNADATLTELARVTAPWHGDCGTVSHDVQTDTIWVTVPGFDSLVSPKLYAFDGEGRELSVQSLDVPGEYVDVSASLVHEGALFLAGSIEIGFSSDAESFAWLERRDAQGVLSWRKIDLPFTTLDTLVGIDGHVSALASLAGPDSESVSLVTLEAASGEVSWTKPVTTNLDIWDLYPWPTSAYAWLGSDGRAELYVTETHLGVHESDPAQTIVTAYADDGETLWRSESEWPGLDRVRGTELVVDQNARISVVSGRDDPDIRPVWLTRHDQDGVLECTALLNQPDPDGQPTPWLWLGNSLTALDDGRFVLSAAVDERLDDPLTVHVPAIFVFEMAAGSADQGR